MATGFDIYQKSAKQAGLTAPTTGRSISSLLPKQEIAPVATKIKSPKTDTLAQKFGTFFKGVALGVPAILERESVGKKLAFEQAKGAGEFLKQNPKAIQAAIEKEKNRTWKDYLPKIDIGTKLESGDDLTEWVVTAAKEAGYQFDARERQEIKDYSQKLAEKYIAVGAEDGQTNWGSVGLMIGESIGQMPFGALPTPAGKALGFLIGTRFNARGNLVQFASQGMDIRDPNVQKLALANAAIDSSVESLSSLMGEGLALKMLAKSPIGKNISFLQRFAGTISADVTASAQRIGAQKTIGEMVKQTAFNMLKGTANIVQEATGEGLEEVWGDIGKAIAFKSYINPNAKLFSTKDGDGGLVSVDSSMQSFAMGFLAGGIFSSATKLPSGTFSEVRSWYKNFSKMTPAEASAPEVVQAGEQAFKNDAKNPVNEPYISGSLDKISKIIAYARDNDPKTFKEKAKDINLAKVVPQVQRDVATRLATKTEAKPVTKAQPAAQAATEAVKAAPAVKTEQVTVDQATATEAVTEPAVVAPVSAEVKPKKVKVVKAETVKAVPAKVEAAKTEAVKTKTEKAKPVSEKPATGKPAEVKKVEAKPEKTKTAEQRQAEIDKAIEKTKELPRVLQPRRKATISEEQSKSFNDLVNQTKSFIAKTAQKQPVKFNEVVKVKVDDNNMNAFMNMLFEKQSALDNAIADGLIDGKEIMAERFAINLIQKHIINSMTFKKANKIPDFDEESAFTAEMMADFDEESEAEYTAAVKETIVDASVVMFTPMAKAKASKYADAMIEFMNTNSVDNLRRTVTSKNWTEFTALANAYYHMSIAQGMDTEQITTLLETLDNIKPNISKIRKSFDVRIKHLFDQYNENYYEDNAFIERMAEEDGFSTDPASANYMGYVFPTEFTEREIALVRLGDQMGFRVVVYESFEKASNAGFFYPDDRNVVYVLREANKVSQGDLVLNTVIHEIGHGIEKMDGVTPKKLKNAIWKALGIKDAISEQRAFVKLRMAAANESEADAMKSYDFYKKNEKEVSEIFAMRYAEIMSNKKALYDFTKAFDEQQISIIDRMLYSLKQAVVFVIKPVETRLAIKATNEARSMAEQYNQSAVKYSAKNTARARFDSVIGKSTSPKYQPVGGVVDESIKANSVMRDADTQTKIDHVKEVWTKNLLRSSVNIDYKEADLRDAVTRLRKSLSTASKLAYEHMRSIYLWLTKDQIKFLQDAILYSDAYNDVKRGTFDVKHPPVEGWTPQLIIDHWENNIEPLLYPKDPALDTAENRKVRERFEKRKRLIKEYTSEVIKIGKGAGMDLSWINNREYYMQHIMLEFINQQSATAGKGKKRLGSPFSGRKGESGLSYLTDPISVDYTTIRHLSQTIAKLNILKVIRRYDITQERGFIKKYGLVKRSDGMYDENRLSELGLKQMLQQDLGISFDNIQKLTAEASKSLSELVSIASPFQKILDWATDSEKLEQAQKGLEKLTALSKEEQEQAADKIKFYKSVIKASTNAEFMAEMKLQSKIAVGAVSKIQNQLFSLNRKNVIIVPAEVADLIMNELAPAKQKNVLDELARLQMSIFKPMMLTAAHKVVEYVARNTFNDISVVTAFLPEVFKPYKKTVASKDGTSKDVMTCDVIEAFIELVKLYKNAEMSKQMHDYVMAGGIGGNMASIEIKDFAKDPNFKQLYDIVNKPDLKNKVGRALIETMKAMIGQNAKIESFVELREQILRYAAFKTFSRMIDEDLKAGGIGQPKFYYASKRVEIQNLSDPTARALKLAEDLMGNYGDVTPFTQAVAKGIFPFLRWKEVDMKRMFRIAQNTLYKNPNTVAEVGQTMISKYAKGAQVGTYAALRVGFVFVNLAILQGVLAAINSATPEDDDLPKEIKESLHLTLPSWLFNDGRIHYISGLNLVSEFANIFDFNTWTNFKSDIQTALKYGMKPQEIVTKILADSAKEQRNNLINGSNPVFKTIIEMTMEKSLYPDPSEPRKIRDPIEHLMTIAGLANEYKAIVGKPIQGGSYLATLGDSVSNSTTKGDAALWTIRAMRAEFEEAKGIGNSYTDTTDAKKSKRQDIAYNYKMALRLGDKNAAKKWLMDYWATGGTGATMKQSLDSLDPLFKMDNAVKREFLAGLSEEDRATYDVAKQYVKELQQMSIEQQRETPRTVAGK